MELSSIFNFAVRFYGLAVNPCHIAGNTVGQKTRSLNSWTKEEFDKFIDTFEVKPLLCGFPDALVIAVCVSRNWKLLLLRRCGSGHKHHNYQ
ncbi:MAG: hypothetical protein ACLU9V_00630 [Roseburia sp.]